MSTFVLSPTQARVDVVDLGKLREHEEADPAHLEALRTQIVADCMLKRPIVADKETNIILDGEHRFNALRQLGCNRVPLVFVDYTSPSIQVRAWRREEQVSKQDVIEAGLTGRKLPAKTTRHLVRVRYGLRHISILQKRVDIPLERLRG